MAPRRARRLPVRIGPFRGRGVGRSFCLSGGRSRLRRRGECTRSGCRIAEQESPNHCQVLRVAVSVRCRFSRCCAPEHDRTVAVYLADFFPLETARELIHNYSQRPDCHQNPPSRQRMMRTCDISRFRPRSLLRRVSFSDAAAQQPPTRGIVNITGQLYRAQNNNHYTVFLVTPEGIIMSDPINRDFARWLKGGVRVRVSRCRFATCSTRIATGITPPAASSLPTRPSSSGTGTCWPLWRRLRAIRR